MKPKKKARKAKKGDDESEAEVELPPPSDHEVNYLLTL